MCDKAPPFLRPSFHYYLSSVHCCEDRFHIHVFNCSSNIWLPYIHNCLFITSRVYLKLTQWPAPWWLGRALHRYRRGHGSNPVQAWIFFRPSFHYFLSSVHYCEDHFHCSSNIWLPYIHNRSFITSRVYLEPTQWPAPRWLVSSVGRAMHRHRRGHGLNPVQAWIFFQAFFSLLLK